MTQDDPMTPHRAEHRKRLMGAYGLVLQELADFPERGFPSRSTIMVAMLAIRKVAESQGMEVWGLGDDPDKVVDDGDEIFVAEKE
jgi:hypothetical protein